MKNLKNIVLILTLISFSITSFFVYENFKSKPPNTQITKLVKLPEFIDAAPISTGTSPIVRIHNSDDKFVCSGTIVSDKYLLTAAHCIVNKDNVLKDTETYYIHVIAALDGKLPDREVRVIEAQAVAVNVLADYGFMIGNFNDLSTYKLAYDPVSVFDYDSTKVAICGYPYGSSQVCYGVNSTILYFNFKLSTTAPMYPGMSGGPAIDLTKDRVFAVNHGVNGFLALLAPLVGLFESTGIRVIK